MSAPAPPLFERAGGARFFDDLVDAFYEGVESDEILRPMYPEDLTESRSHLSLFLQQYWGGPTTYSDARGHPRLRMRHAPFEIAQPERDAWLGHMAAAVERSGAPAEIASELMAYFDMASTAMINAGPHVKQGLGISRNPPN